MRIREELRELKVKYEKAEAEEKKKLVARKDELLGQLEQMNKEPEKDKEYAQGLIDKLFERYSKGKSWLEWAKDMAASNGYVFSPIGRRRNHYGILTGIEAIVSAMMRRGVNSPIQGSASDVSLTTARLVAINVYDYLTRLGELEESMFLPGEIEKFVHDALHSEVAYKHVIPYLHILQWTASYGVTEYYKKEFGWEFNIEPEISIEMGATEDALNEWDWSDEGLKKAIRKSVEEQKEHGLVQDVDEVMEEIYAPMKNEKLRKWLNKKYPILGVVDE
jgi:hypothetical protein